MAHVPIILGYIASALILATFWMRSPVRLRQVAIGSNVACLIYGVLAHAWPIAVLNALLLPMNARRLYEIEALARKVENAVAGDLSMDWLRPFMHPRKVKAGEFLFHKGDTQTDVYYIVAGTVRLLEIDVLLTAGQLIGEMAIFSPKLERSLSAVCASDVEILSMPHDEVLKLYVENPKFGLFLVRLITRRLLHDTDILGKTIDARNGDLEKIRALTDVDEATGLANRRAFAARLHMEWARAIRTPASLSLVVLRIEDIHDHPWTNEVLMQIAVGLASCASRASDFLARHDKDFVAILPTTSLEGASAIAKEMSQAIESLDIPAAKIWRGDLLVRIGLACCVPDKMIAPEKLLEDAYRALSAAEASRAPSRYRDALTNPAQSAVQPGDPPAEG